MSIDIVAEFFLGNKQKTHQTDISSLSTQAENPDIARARRNKFAMKAQETPKAA
jgi:hypothetical protein